MNKPAWLFGVSTFLLGGSCLYLLMQSRGESAPASEGGQSDAEVQTELRQVRAERDRLETDVRSMRAAQAGPVFAPQPLAAATGAPASAPTPPTFRADFTPKTRRTMARLRNGKMFKQLGLSEAQVESLLDVLAAQDERTMSQKLGDPPANQDELRGRNRAEVAAVIGQESAVKLDEWQQALMARIEVRRLRDQFEDVGEPLSAPQLTRVTELIHARPQTSAPARQKDESNEAFMERFKSWRNDNREQTRGEVSSVLEPRQLERYDELDEMSRSFEKNLSLPVPPLAAALPLSAAAGRAAPPVR